MLKSIRAASAGAAMTALAATGSALGTAATPAAAAPTAKEVNCWGGYISSMGGLYLHGRYSYCDNGKFWVKDTAPDRYAPQIVINGKRCTASGYGNEKTCWIDPRGAKYMYTYLVRGYDSTYMGRWRLPH